MLRLYLVEYSSNDEPESCAKLVYVKAYTQLEAIEKIVEEIGTTNVNIKFISEEH